MTVAYNLELNVDFYCIESKEKGSIKFDLDLAGSKEDSNVFDFKLALQSLLSAPACDLSLFYEGKALNDDKLSLKQLHFRDQDRIIVEFSANVDISEMQELCLDMKRFSSSILHHKKNYIDVSTSLDDIKYDLAKETLRRLSLKFVPWKNRTAMAHRHYFVQEGGLNDFMEIFRFSALKVRGPPQSEQDLTLNNNLLLLNGHHKALNILCLRFLWNFCETKQDCQLVLTNSQVQKLVFEGLLVDPDKRFPYCANGQLSSVLSSINQEAIGCLAGLSEISSTIQEGIAKNGLLVRKLLLMLDRRGHKAIMHYSVFSSQLAANVLFNCTFNPQALKFLVQKGVHYKMMRVTQRLLEDRSGDLALRYYSALFLSRVRSSTGDDLQDDGSAQTIDRIIDRFLRLHQPCEIIEWQEEHSYNWMTLVPLVQLAYAGGSYCKCDDTAAIGNESLDVTMVPKPCECGSCKGQSPKPKKSKTKENAHSWCCEAALYENIEISTMYESKVSYTATCQCLQKFNNICAIPPSWPGSCSTQKMGLFGLQCALAVEENWGLLVGEGLLSYLTTLNWQLRSNERVILQKVLNVYKKAWNPPSLQVIAKSVFAKRNGLSVIKPLF